MEKDEIIKLVMEVIKDYLTTQDIVCEVNKQTSLIGDNAIVDSIGLVTIIIDIESRLLDKGCEVSLTSEKAMSKKISPFRTVNSLSSYIIDSLNEK
ncbi:MAG: hypothetical protein ACMUIL_06080 [bacterium]